MIAWLDRGWRALVTGGCVAAVSLGGMLLSISYFPLLRLLVREAPRRHRLVRQALGGGFGWVLRAIQWAGVARIVFEDRERLEKFAGLVVANHPTLLDTVVLMAAKPSLGCVVKRALWDHPFLRGVVRAAGYVPNQADPESFIQDCVRELHSGHSLLIFPEGTRSSGCSLRAFQRGAAAVAILSQGEVLPVVVTCDPPALAKGTKWYQVPPSRFTLTLRVGQPLGIKEQIQDCPSRAIAARRVTAYLGTTGFLVG